jgi:hypothetical protein
MKIKEINVTKRKVIQILTNAISNEAGIEDLRSFTMNYFSGDYRYKFESPDIENFFHEVEDYNTYDESFGDANQKFTLLRLRDALIKYGVWEAEMLRAVTIYDEINLLDARRKEGKLSAKEFKVEVSKYCNNVNVEKVLDFFCMEKKS